MESNRFPEALAAVRTLQKLEAEEVQSVLRERHGRIEMEWEIPKFLELPHPPGTNLRSPSFLLGDASFCLCIYPNGFKKEYADDWIALFVVRVSRAGEQKVSFSFRINHYDLSLKDVEYRKTFGKGNSSWWNKQFFSRMDLLEQYDDAIPLTIICDFRIMDSRNLSFEGAENLSKSYEQVFLSNYETDVKLRVREKEFSVHKLVLGVRSPVFRAMFQHKMTESNSGVVEISDFEFQIFEDFLLFVYTGKLDHVTPTNALGLYKAADKYDLMDLKSECTFQISSGLNVDIVLEVISLAELHEETKLLEAAKEYLIKNGEDIIVTDKWKTFLSENSELANDLLVKMANIAKQHFKT